MRLYRIQIKAESGFTSPLQSDTFFGAFCWSYRYLYGEEALQEEIVGPSAEGRPACIFSNAFQAGYLPLPLGLRDPARQKEREETDKEAIRQNYQKAKKIKKAGLISTEYFRKLQNGETEGFSTAVAKEDLTDVQQLRNLVSREAGTVRKDEEGGASLYSVDEFYPQNDRRMDVYILTSLEEERLLPVLRMMFQLGIGGKKSVGKGQFALCAGDGTDGKILQECGELLEQPEADAVVLLSNMIPAHADPTGGCYKTMVKYGKLDREYAMGESPFKKPLLFLKSGAMLLLPPGSARKAWYGRCATGVSLEHPEVIVSGYAIALPLKRGESCDVPA